MKETWMMLYAAEIAGIPGAVTGDSTPVLIWIIVLIAAAGVLIGALISLIMRNNGKKTRRRTRRSRTGRRNGQ